MDDSYGDYGVLEWRVIHRKTAEASWGECLPKLAPRFLLRKPLKPEQADQDRRLGGSRSESLPGVRSLR